MPCLHLYKVGGSLMRNHQWKVVMQQVLEQHQQHEVPIFLMGGGALADAVREHCALHQVSVEAEHAMSLLAMQQNALLAASQFNTLKSCRSVEQTFERFLTYTPGIWVVLASINCGLKLQSSNSITSDSIALYLAQALALHAQTQRIACEIKVTLLKSCEVPTDISHNANALVARGIVDEAFSEFAMRLQPYANASWRVVSAAQAFMAERTAATLASSS